MELWDREKRVVPTDPLQDFSTLLSRLYDKLSIKGADNTGVGFKKTGLYPLNPKEMLRTYLAVVTKMETPFVLALIPVY